MHCSRSFPLTFQAINSVLIDFSLAMLKMTLSFQKARGSSWEIKRSLLYLLVWFDKFTDLLRFTASYVWTIIIIIIIHTTELRWNSIRPKVQSQIQASSKKPNANNKKKCIIEFTCVSGDKVMKLFVFKVHNIHIIYSQYFVSDNWNWHWHFPHCRTDSYAENQRTKRHEIKLNYRNI